VVVGAWGDAFGAGPFQGSAYVFVQPDKPDLAVTKSDSPDPVQAGNNLTYTVTVKNNGPGNATGVTMTDTLPADVSFVSANASQGSCTGTSTVVCNLGSLAASASATVTLVVKPTAAGTITNTASVTGSPTDPNTGNNSATEMTTVTPAADLAVTKSDSPDPVLVSDHLTYTVTVTNNGPSNATGVTMTDTLPASMSFVSATPSQGTCSGTSTVTCTLGSLAASVTGNENDPTPANNSATEQTTVNPLLCKRAHSYHRGHPGGRYDYRHP
jgi:uncharacterized repeat protein (TIGR01451 family)